MTLLLLFYRDAKVAEQAGRGTSATSCTQEDNQVVTAHGESSVENRNRRAGGTINSIESESLVPSNIIVVREIPNPVDSKSLKQFFNSSFGPVRDVRIPQSQFSTRSKSYGFVEFVRVETAQKVVEKAAVGSVVYQGSKLEITFASDGFEKKGWDCLACGYANFARRRVCKQCGAKKEINDILGTSQSKFIAGDAVLAAQWSASSQGMVDYSPYANYCLDPRSGWYYDPQTLYYVVDPFHLVFYDWSRQIYLQYNSATGTYVEYATAMVNPPPNQNTGDVVSASQNNPSSESTNLEQVVQTESAEATGESVHSDGMNIDAQETSTKETIHEEKKALPSTKVVVTPMKPRGRILSNIQRWNQRLVERRQILEEFEESEKEEEPSQEEKTSTDENEQLEENILSDVQQTETDQHNCEQEDNLERVSNASIVTVDETKQICICELCRRKFKSNDILEKHIQFSELHRTNLMKQNSMYRDRAAERRKLFPTDDVESKSNGSRPKKRSFSSKKATNQPSQPLESSIGAKLMKSMGWKEGQGLGREASGITAPITAIANRGQSGLGLEPLNDPELHIHPTDSQKERLRKETLLRWKMKFGNLPVSRDQ